MAENAQPDQYFSIDDMLAFEPHVATLDPVLDEFCPGPDSRGGHRLNSVGGHAAR
jgi:hypothetical protein